MSIPDRVDINPDDLWANHKPVTKYCIVLTHNDGTVEVAIAESKNVQQPYSVLAYAHAAAKQYLDTGCYSSVVLAPCRTLGNNASNKAYEEAFSVNYILTHPNEWMRKNGKWVYIDPIDRVYTS